MQTLAAGSSTLQDRFRYCGWALRTIGKRADDLRAADPLVIDLSFLLEADDAASGLPFWSKVLLLLALLVPLRIALSSLPIAC